MIVNPAVRMEDSENKMDTFKVIGCGLPRTGTNSLQLALQILLKGKCCHGTEIAMNSRGSEQLDFWLDHSKTPQEMGEFLLGQGYVAGVDVPISLNYQQLMKVFPSAKLILTVREPTSWYKSMSTLFEGRKLLDQLSTVIFLSLLGKSRTKEFMDESLKEISNHHKLGEDESVKYFNDWTKQVKENVPEERLLVFNVKEGWKPLCDFLNLPIPEEDFPRVNSSVELFQRYTWSKWIDKAFQAACIIGIATITHYYVS